MQKNGTAAEAYKKTVGLLAEMVAYYSKKGAMNPNGASFSANFKIALVC